MSKEAANDKDGKPANNEDVTGVTTDGILENEEEDLVDDERNDNMDVALKATTIPQIEEYYQYLEAEGV